MPNSGNLTLERACMNKLLMETLLLVVCALNGNKYLAKEIFKRCVGGEVHYLAFRSGCEGLL